MYDSRLRKIPRFPILSVLVPLANRPCVLSADGSWKGWGGSGSVLCDIEGTSLLSSLISKVFIFVVN